MPSAPKNTLNPHNVPKNAKDVVKVQDKSQLPTNRDLNPVVRMEKKGGSAEQQELIAYTFARCGADCVYTFEAESGWRFDAVSRKNSDGSQDFSYCQLNSRYHGDFLRSPDAKDKYKVLDRCIGVWHDAVKKKRLKTTFYAYNVINVRPGVRDNFILHY